MTRYLAPALLLLLSACNNDPVAGKTQAKTSAPTTAENPPEPVTSVTLPITKDSGTIGFVGAKITDKHEGSFKDFSGAITLATSGIEQSSVKLAIDVASMVIEPEKLKQHLVSADFFEAEKFPQAEFESTKITKAGDGYLVMGNLTLRGVKKGITFPAKIETTDSSASVKAEFGINRKDFDITYPGMPDDLIKDEVLIKVDLTAKK